MKRYCFTKAIISRRACVCFLTLLMLCAAVFGPASHAVVQAATTDNLLAGKQPVQFYVSGGSYNLGTKALDGCYYIDGKTQAPTEALYSKLTNGIEDTAKENCLYFKNDYYTQKRALVLIYDLGDTYDLTSMRLVSDTGNDRVGAVRFYAGNSVGTTNDERAALFAAANRVDTFADAQVDETGIAQQTLSGVSARYVAFVIMKGLVDGVAQDNQTFIRELEVRRISEAETGVDKNLINGKLPIYFYMGNRDNYAERVTTTAFRVDSVNVDTSLNVEDMNETVKNGLQKITDGETEVASGNGCVIYSYDTNKDITKNAVMVLVYDLGGLADVSKMYFASTNESGHYVAGYDFFVSEQLDDLLTAGNCVYTSNGNAVNEEGEWLSDNDITEREFTKEAIAKSARYAAVVITRPDSFDAIGGNRANYRARVAEFAVYGANKLPVEFLGGQVRGKNATTGDIALRFGFDMTCTGVDYANPGESYERKLDNAKVFISGKEYELVDFGAIVSIDPDEDMTLKGTETSTRVKAVPAQRLYDVSGNVVRYTAVITNVPSDKMDSSIYTCSYITYKDNGQEVTVYGDTYFRTVNQVVDSTELI